jgi:hypothetical protein
VPPDPSGAAPPGARRAHEVRLPRPSAARVGHRPDAPPGFAPRSHAPARPAPVAPASDAEVSRHSGRGRPGAPGPPRSETRRTGLARFRASLGIQVITREPADGQEFHADGQRLRPDGMVPRPETEQGAPRTPPPCTCAPRRAPAATRSSSLPGLPQPLVVGADPRDRPARAARLKPGRKRGLDRPGIPRERITRCSGPDCRSLGYS